MEIDDWSRCLTVIDVLWMREKSNPTDRSRMVPYWDCPAQNDVFPDPWGGEADRRSLIGFVSASSRLCLSYVSVMPRLRISCTSTTTYLRLNYALASISCEHCRSSRNNPHCAPGHVIYYYNTLSNKQKHITIYAYTNSGFTEKLYCIELSPISELRAHLCLTADDVSYFSKNKGVRWLNVKLT